MKMKQTRLPAGRGEAALPRCSALLTTLSCAVASYSKMLPSPAIVPAFWAGERKRAMLAQFVLLKCLADTHTL